ncbi:hypothetical protein RRG08_028164 [Elysia crispata]|uniref:Uncharacterized protein n=1 Tax=Elysia crispata TaxID=231223 RepID=A0AAE0YQ64_9GAST|nr:hypothetical protein RRG08_028164 [Elysia crispata]
MEPAAKKPLWPKSSERTGLNHGHLLQNRSLETVTLAVQYVRAECNRNASTLKNFFQQVKSRDEDDLLVIRAEALFANAIVEHNLPLALADHMSDLFTKMFPDSQIAKKYAAGRTKTRGLVQVLADSAESSMTTEIQ